MSSSADHTATVEVTVIRLLPFGLLVRLPDERIGIIREREIAWSRAQRRRWRKQFKPGSTHPAVILGPGHENRLELSLRLAESDPWATLLERYQLGQVVRGIVRGVQNYGVFVEIENGVTGLLHQTRLPVWAQPHALEALFWPGDAVNVAIEHLDPQHRRLGLTMLRVWPQRWKSSADALSPLPLSPDELDPLPEVALPQLAWVALVIEDDQVQRDAVAGWLSQAGQQVFAAESAEAGLQILAEQAIDIVLMDFNLPGISGVEALAMITRRWPHIRRVLMTDWAIANEHAHDIDLLLEQGAQLLIKPLLPDDLAGMLAEAPPSPPHLDSARATRDLALPTPAQLLPSGRLNQLSRLEELLRQLVQATDTQHAIVFTLDPTQRKVAIVAEAGTAELNHAALSDVIYSPVRDVAEDRQPFRIDDAQPSEVRVRYLRPLLAFRACLGVPLETHLDECYALFLFSAVPRSLKDSPAEQHAITVGLAASALLERGKFVDHMWNLQRLGLMGQLSRALVHEINHQLSPISFTLTDLERQLGAVSRLAQQSPDRVEPAIDAAHTILHDLLTSVSRLTTTARMFGRITVQSKEQMLQVGRVVDDVCYLVHDMADRAHVRLTVIPLASLPLIRTHAAQLQQILLNIVINAIQQIELARPHEGGQIQIRMVQQTRNGHPTVQISVEDDAPGIHREHWERVFELGYTTRSEGGSGLGLYITRSLVEALGGRVWLDDSLMLWGSTFTVELPMQ